MKTGNTIIRQLHVADPRTASMEPGHEDRDYAREGRAREGRQGASMEPGHEDREYPSGSSSRSQDENASMEPGHEDREYLNELNTYADKTI